MPRYHLHLRDAHLDANDKEGHDLADLEAAKAKALAGIRDMISHEAMSGNLDFRGHVYITNENNEVLAKVSFKEAFTIIGL